jgi:hypothetical protein
METLIYHITKSTSETGKKFAKIAEKIPQVTEAQKAFAKKYGFKAWRPDPSYMLGGITRCFEFEKEPDSKIWAKGPQKGDYFSEGPSGYLPKGAYFPKSYNDYGKPVWQEIQDLNRITKREVNMCVGFNAIHCTIGFSVAKGEFFGFTTKKDWGVSPPKDCEEVTGERYTELFISK